MSPNTDRFVPDLLSREEERISSALKEIMDLAHNNSTDVSLIPPLLVVLDNGTTECRKMASWSLGKMAQSGLGDEPELEHLTLALSDLDEEVRENAAWALGELAGHHLGTAEELAPLIALLDDENATVRGMAAWALGRLAQRMNLINDKAVEPLERLTSDRSLYVSKGAEFALQRLKERL